MALGGGDFFAVVGFDDHAQDGSAGDQSDHHVVFIQDRNAVDFVFHKKLIGQLKGVGLFERNHLVRRSQFFQAVAHFRITSKMSQELKQSSLSNDADQPTAHIDQWCPTDLSCDEQLGNFPQLHLRGERGHRGGHYVFDQDLGFFCSC